VAGNLTVLKGECEMKVWIACTVFVFDEDEVHHFGVFDTEEAATAAANNAVDKEVELYGYGEESKKYLQPRVMEFELNKSIWEV
jgi:hypothetical protein